MKPKKRITEADYIKANRIASRDAEIEDHGHPVCHKRVHKSKKIYDRKRKKAGDKGLPFFSTFTYITDNNENNQKNNTVSDNILFNGNLCVGNST